MRCAGGLTKGRTKARGRKPRRLAAAAKSMAVRRDPERQGTTVDVSRSRQKRLTGRARPPTTKAQSAAPSARSGGPDNVDGCPNPCAYSESLPCRQRQV